MEQLEDDSERQAEVPRNIQLGGDDANSRDRVERPLDSEGNSIYSLRSDGPPLATLTPRVNFGEEPTQYDNGPTLQEIIAQGNDAEQQPGKPQELDGESLFSRSSSSSFSSGFFTKSAKLAIENLKNLGRREEDKESSGFLTESAKQALNQLTNLHRPLPQQQYDNSGTQNDRNAQQQNNDR